MIRTLVLWREVSFGVLSGEFSPPISRRLTALTVRSELPRCQNLNSKPTSSLLSQLNSGGTSKSSDAHSAASASAVNSHRARSPLDARPFVEITSTARTGCATTRGWPARQQTFSRYRLVGSRNRGRPPQRKQPAGSECRTATQSALRAPIRPFESRPSSRHSRGAGAASASVICRRSTAFTVGRVVSRRMRWKPMTISWPPSSASSVGTSKSNDAAPQRNSAEVKSRQAS